MDEPQDMPIPNKVYMHFKGTIHIWLGWWFKISQGGGVAISFWNFHVRMNIYHLFGKKKNSEDNFL